MQFLRICSRKKCVLQVLSKFYFSSSHLLSNFLSLPGPISPSRQLYSDPSALNDALDGTMGGLDDQFGYGENQGRGDDKYGGGNFGGSGKGSSMELADDGLDQYGANKDDFEGVSGGRQKATSVDDWKANLAPAKEIIPEDVARPACTDWKAEYSVEPGVSWGSLPFDLQEKWKAYDCDTYVLSW
jgi:hypothetical protein